MSMRPKLRQLDTFKLIDNSPSIGITVGGGYVERRLLCLLQMQPTLTAANNTPGNWKRGEEFAYIKELRVRTIGGEVLYRIPGYFIRKLQRALRGRVARLTPTIGDGATANPTIKTYFEIPFEAIGMNNPMDSALLTQITGDLIVEVDTGDFTSLNALASAWTVAPTLKAWAVSVPSTVFCPYAMPRLRYFKYDILAVGEQNFDLKPGYNVRGYVGAFHIAGVEQTAASMTSYIQLYNSSGNVMDPVDPDVLLQDYEVTGGMQDLFERALGTASVDDVTGAASGFYAQYYQNTNEQAGQNLVLEFPEDGNVNGYLPTKGWPEWKLKINALQTGTLELIAIEGEQIPVNVVQTKLAGRWRKDLGTPQPDNM